MENFTPVPSLIGGLMIGLAAAGLLLCDGQVAGISGIVAGVLRPVRTEIAWRLCFIAGMLAGGVALRIYMPHAFTFTVARSAGAIALAGLLVGFGTRLGNGCTSGHGVCGVSRLSPRSISATLTFIAVGAAVVYLVNHLFGGYV
jgi:uncharacterized protein